MENLPDSAGAQVPKRVLFLCTHNSARSQIAEALLRSLSNGTVEAFSAGSSPTPQLHPLAQRCMEEQGIDTSQARPKHFKQFAEQHFNAVIMVCDQAKEVCPTFPDNPEVVYWSIPDPVSVQGTEAEQLQAFRQITIQLTTRIRLLLALLQRE